MALILPDINGSSGVWGTILNDALNGMDVRITNNANTGAANSNAIATNTTAINGLDSRLDTVEAGGGATTTRIYSTTVNVTTTSGGTVGSATVSFPGGTFSSAPTVVTTINSAATANERVRYVSRVHSVVSGGATIEIGRGDGAAFTTTSSVPVCVIAHQN